MGALVTVIVPVHNKRAALGLTAPSLTSQSSNELCEIIYVDDRSSDGSIELIEGLANRENVRILKPTDSPGSAARARNAGLAAARGTYCLFLDADVLVGSGFLAEVCTCVAGPGVVLLIPTIGSSCSAQTWPLVSGVSLDSSEPDSILRACVHGSMNDPRLQWCESAGGDIGAFPAPWVFCWTTALLVDTNLARQAGGFPSYLPGKGSEDLAFGLRLHEAGARFQIPRMSPVLHLPHSRDSVAEDRRDREHERIMLRNSPRFDVEMLAAFGGDNVNRALATFDAIRHVRLIEDWPRIPSPVKLTDRGRVLLLGAACPNLLEAFQPTDLIDPSFTELTEARRLPLLGLALPFEDEELEWAVVPDMRGLIPESLICRIFQEASRAARHVLVALLHGPPRREPLISESAARQIDRPYWERSFRISRSYYDWDLIHSESRGSFELYELTAHTFAPIADPALPPRVDSYGTRLQASVKH